MKPMLVFFVGLVFSLSVKAGDDDYLPYYRLVSKARVYVSEEKFDSATATFREAFTTYERIFPRDVYMAMIGASMVHDHDNISWFFLKGVPYGINPNCFDSLYRPGRNEDYFAVYRKSGQYRQAMKEYPALRRKYEEAVNIPYRLEIVNLGLRLHAAYDPMKRLVGAAERIQSDTAQYLMVELQQLIQKNGFPSVFRIGTTGFTRDAGGNYEDWFGTDDKLGYWIFEKYWTSAKEYGEQLRKAMLAGELHICYYAFLLDQRAQYKSNIVNGNMVSFDDATYFYSAHLPPEKVLPDVLKRINANRLRDGLMSYEEQHKLIHGMYYVRPNPDGSDQPLFFRFEI